MEQTYAILYSSYTHDFSSDILEKIFLIIFLSLSKTYFYAEI